MTVDQSYLTEGVAVLGSALQLELEQLQLVLAECGDHVHHLVPVIWAQI